MYRVAMAVCKPVVAAWGRLEVEGLDALPASGPVLVVGNHDSHWDPVVVGVAAIRRRQIKALAKSTLWDVRGLGPVLNGMGQIPIERGAGDAEPCRGRSRSCGPAPASASSPKAPARAARCCARAAASAASRSRSPRRGSSASRSRAPPT